MQEEVGDIVPRARAILEDLEGIQASVRATTEQLRTASDSCTEHAAVVAKVAAEVQDQQAINAEYSKYIEDANAHAAASIETLKAAGVACASAQDLATSSAAGASEAAAQATESAKSAEESMKEAAASRDEARTASETAKVHQRDLQALAAVADAKEARVQAYEEQLKALMEKCAAQQEEITKLLPGATSAGLASAYRKRRGAFVWPAWIWQGIFVAALIALIVLAGWGLSDTRTAEGNVRELPELVRLWMTRLPIAGALIWLALHAGQEGALARRLEEDYGYKETVAASFQGFQEQMANVAKDTDPQSALARLCNDVLATLAAPPGRIYEKHALAALPSDLAKRVVDGLAEKLKAENGK